MPSVTASRFARFLSPEAPARDRAAIRTEEPKNRRTEEHLAVKLEAKIFYAASNDLLDQVGYTGQLGQNLSRSFWAQRLGQHGSAIQIGVLAVNRRKNEVVAIRPEAASRDQVAYFGFLVNRKNVGLHEGLKLLQLACHQAEPGGNQDFRLLVGIDDIAEIVEPGTEKALRTDRTLAELLAQPGSGVLGQES